jgi:methylated-DNA-[protein]-cysteine S-methyltransferase
MITSVYWTSMTSPFFDHRSFLIAATEKGLCNLLFPHKGYVDLESWVNTFIPDAVIQEDENKLSDYICQLQEYFDGKRTKFSLPLDIRGTAFQQDVWRALTQIPAGKTVAYGDIANAIGRPKSVRAVGVAVGANPLPIIVPCHRVIGKNKTLTGFGGGLEIKKKLLQLEGVSDYIDRGHQKYQF